MQMYELFNQISGLLSEPINEPAYGFEHIPVLFAFFLGMLGTVVPCQLSGNVSAITIYGNKPLTVKAPWLYVSLFMLGKITVFTLLGLIIRSEEHTSELQSRFDLVCSLLLVKKKNSTYSIL